MSFCPKNKMKKLEAIEIEKSFGKLHTINNVSLELEENQFVSILGPSGSGKSSLFNIISGLVKPDSGKIFIEGQEFTGRTGRVSYMQQKDLLLPWRTILDNVSIPLLLKGMKLEAARGTAREYFQSFGLSGFEESYPSQLSGGMRQRAALLRTYLFSKDIMLLDEPFGGLDAITRRKMQQWLMEVLSELKASIIFITHDIDEAIFLSDKIYIFSERPATVKAVFEVGLPRPRNTATLTCEAFTKMKEEILRLL